MGPGSAGEMPPLLIQWVNAAKHVEIPMKWKGLLKWQMLFNIPFNMLVFIFLWGEVKPQQYWEMKGYAASIEEGCTSLIRAKHWGTTFRRLQRCVGGTLRSSGAHFLWWSWPLLRTLQSSLQKPALLQGLLKIIQGAWVMLFIKTNTNWYSHSQKKKPNKTSNSNKPLVLNKLK